MLIITKFKKLINNPAIRFGYFTKLGLYNWLDDEKFLKKKWKLVFGSELDLKNPKTYNEKLQWLKLNDRKEIYTTMVDKAEAKKYVSDIIGEEYIIPTIGVYDRFDDIDFDKLPDQFVIKCTHDSGGIVICKNKAELDVKAARKKINKFLKRKYYYMHREWPYKNVKPRIIVEKYMEDKNNKTMRDYKFFCFDGEAKIVYVSDGSHSENQKIAFFDMSFNYLPIERTDYKKFDVLPKKPKNFDKMKKLSARLSSNIPHVRVDWYEIDGRLYFGEFTFSTCAGMVPFTEKKWDEELGKLINLNLVGQND